MAGRTPDWGRARWDNPRGQAWVAVLGFTIGSLIGILIAAVC